MTLDAFRAHLGVEQGRVARGDGHVLVLGSRTPGRVHALTVGDFAELTQRADLTGADLVRVTATCVVSTTTASWTLTLRVDGVVYARRVLPPGRRVEVRDLAANVAGLSGEHEVAVRLELEAT